MKKQWWEYFSYIGGAAFIAWNIFDRFSPLGFTLMGIGIVSTVIYFFNQQKNS